MGSHILQSPQSLRSSHIFQNPNILRISSIFGFMLFSFVGLHILQIVWVCQLLVSCCSISWVTHSLGCLGLSINNFVLFGTQVCTFSKVSGLWVCRFLAFHWFCEFLNSYFVEVFKFCGFLKFFLFYQWWWVLVGHGRLCCVQLISMLPLKPLNFKFK